MEGLFDTLWQAGEAFKRAAILVQIGGAWARPCRSLCGGLESYASGY
jgi:hypothetical protein